MSAYPGSDPNTTGYPHPHTVIHAHVPPMAMPPPPLMPTGPDPMLVTCPYCNKAVTTVTDHRANWKTHLFAILLCGTLCCCVPYFVDSCMTTVHKCPGCQRPLATYGE